MLPFIFTFLKIGLANDIIPNGHLFVGKNYSKLKTIVEIIWPSTYL